MSDGKGGFVTATAIIHVPSAQQQIETALPDVEALVAAGILNDGQGNSLSSKLAGATLSK